MSDVAELELFASLAKAIAASDELSDLCGPPMSNDEFARALNETIAKASRDHRTLDEVFAACPWLIEGTSARRFDDDGRKLGGTRVKYAAVMRVLANLYLDGIPDMETLPNAMLCAAVAKHLPYPVGDDTILRAAGRK